MIWEEEKPSPTKINFKDLKTAVLQHVMLRPVADHYPTLNMGRHFYQLVFKPSMLASVPSTYLCSTLHDCSLLKSQVYHNSVALHVKKNVSAFCRCINIFYTSSFSAFDTTEI
jgi:hypothetical protein